MAPPLAILAESERHRQAHLAKLTTYKQIEQECFPNLDTLTPEAKFQYLTLYKGIGYETDWLAWCDKAIQLLS